MFATPPKIYLYLYCCNNIIRAARESNFVRFTVVVVVVVVFFFHSFIPSVQFVLSFFSVWFGFLYANARRTLSTHSHNKLWCQPSEYIDFWQNMLCSHSIVLVLSFTLLPFTNYTHRVPIIEKWFCSFLAHKIQYTVWNKWVRTPLNTKNITEQNPKLMATVKWQMGIRKSGQAHAESFGITIKSFLMTVEIKKTINIRINWLAIFT